MSSDGRPYLTSDDLAMLERVLAQAEFPRSVDALKAEARSDATRLLIARFQRGETNERRLRETLSDMDAIEDYPREAAGYDIAVSISPADATTILPGVQYGYGRRIAFDRPSTTCHVGTDIPASIGRRPLVQLDAKSAIRAHRILNAPRIDHGGDEGNC